MPQDQPMRVFIVSLNDVPLAVHQMPAAPATGDLGEWYRTLSQELRQGYQDTWPDAKININISDVAPLPFDPDE